MSDHIDHPQRNAAIKYKLTLEYLNGEVDNLGVYDDWEAAAGAAVDAGHAQWDNHHCALRLFGYARIRRVRE